MNTFSAIQKGRKRLRSESSVGLDGPAPTQVRLCDDNHSRQQMPATELNSVARNANTSTTQAKRSMLEKLPAEIRQQILREVIPHGNTIDIWVFWKRAFELKTCYLPGYFVNGPWLPLKFAWSLFLVSKTICDDAMYTFYGQNKFIFSLNFDVSQPQVRWNGALFYSLAGQKNAFKMPARIASYIRQCEVIYINALQGKAPDVLERADRVKEWISGFVNAFETACKRRMDFETHEQTYRGWKPVWDGTIGDYADSKAIRDATTCKAIYDAKNFKIVLSGKNGAGSSQSQC